MLKQVSDLKFAQPARRNLLAPVLLAFLILGIVLALLLRFTPHRNADLTITRTTIYPTHTVFTFTNSRIPYAPNSRPKPECFRSRRKE